MSAGPDSDITATYPLSEAGQTSLRSVTFPCVVIIRLSSLAPSSAQRLIL